MMCYIFVPGLFFIVCSHIGSFMVFWSLGFLVLGVALGFRGSGCQLMGLGVSGVGLLGFWGWISLYRHTRVTLGKRAPGI